jgi:hypothetical protein
MPNESDGGAPRADRPNIPYGLVAEEEGAGLIPWSRAEDRLRHAYLYWVCTVDTSGRPHSVPVWGLWDSGAFYFSNGATTRTGRALAAHSRVSVHLESGEDVVMFEGDVTAIADEQMVDRLNGIYGPKYTWPDRVEGWYEVRPDKAYAWLSPSIGLGDHGIFQKTAMRWRFA